MIRLQIPSRNIDIEITEDEVVFVTKTINQLTHTVSAQVKQFFTYFSFFRDELLKKD